jgi:superfamily II DNA or RNA helicase
MAGWVCVAAGRAGVGPGLTALWCAGVLALAASAWWPQVALYAFFAVALGTPRYRESYATMVQLGSEIIRLALEKGNTVLWLVHRRNLVYQMRDTLKMFGIEPGIIMAGEKSDTVQKVQIGTYQTYQRRLQIEGGGFFIDASLVLIDEAHRSLSESSMEILNRYEGKVIIGCTATPVRADYRPMGKLYDKIVDVISVQELTDNGFLAKARYFAAPVDLDGIKLVRGDYDVKQLDAKVNTAKLVGDIVQNWLRIAQNRPTIVFCVTVKHSIHVCEEFQRHGITAMHLDANSNDDERDEAFRKMESGEVTVLCNVALYQEGMDCPNISCVIMGRSTKSLGLYRQCCGRGLRPKKGGFLDCIVLDHGGVIEEHGLLTDEVEWALHGKEKAWTKKKLKEKTASVSKCPSCQAVFEGLKHCPDCGTELKKFGKKIETVDADLQEVAGKKKFSEVEKRQFYGMCVYYARQKGYQEGWISHKYREKIGVWPRGMKFVAPIEPDQSCKNWLTHFAIKAAKSKMPPRNEIERLARNLPGID